MNRDIVAERAEIDQAISGRTVCSVFAERVAGDSDAEALEWPDPHGSWWAMTWADYGDRVRTLTLALRARGSGKGQFGMIMARNRPRRWDCDHGEQHAGARADPVPRQPQ